MTNPYRATKGYERRAISATIQRGRSREGIARCRKTIAHCLRMARHDGHDAEALRNWLIWIGWPVSDACLANRYDT